MTLFQVIAYLLIAGLIGFVFWAAACSESDVSRMYRGQPPKRKEGE